MSSKTAKLVLKKNKKLDKIYHPDTGLVFKSATEKVVIGRIVDDEFVPLDEEAVELCEKNSFKVDESLLETDEAEEPETKKKSSSKKKSEEETEETEETEEPPKGKKAPPKEEEKKPVNDSKAATPAKDSKAATPAKDSKATPANDSLDCFAKIIARHNKELQDYVSGHQTESEAVKEQVAELEKQLASAKKDLEEVRKKLKGVLSAMQGDL